MDATVNDFLKEINQISSKKDPNEESSEVWQECYDELTGFSYFWNTETDEVTWVPPKSYKPADNSSKKNNTTKPPTVEKEKKKVELFVPPTAVSSTPYSTASVKPEAKVKVYSIQEAIKKPVVKQNVRPVNSSTSKKAPFRKPNDSDDEKIELITEYGGDSDSDPEEQPNKNSQISALSPVRKISPPIKSISSPVRQPSNASKKSFLQRQRGSQSEEDDDDEDIDLLSKIQQRAQELKKLGGELPPAVEQIIQNSDIKSKVEKPKAISGFSLVAGYNSASSDSESERESTPPPKAVFPVAPPPKPIPETSHSTLFPITKPIDVKDFIEPEPLPPEDVKQPENAAAPNSDFDNKAFQRKRRIGISLVNSVKRAKEDLHDSQPPSTEFAGFGFKTESNNVPEKAAVYPGFQKGGLMFVKSDVLNPSLPSEEKRTECVDKEESSIDKKETESDYTVLREKLLFLGEGREPVLPVQAMLIQAETLFLAMREGGLKLSYLYKWLKEMCSELIKLEKEAAPEGWLLQWDRSHKRYFYQNQVTGVSQWRYPEPDVTRCDDAMDICTTPPPQDFPRPIGPPLDVNPVSPVMYGPQLPEEPPLPPSPPQIRSPTPPPPPMISGEEPSPAVPDVPLPPEPSLPQPVVLHPPMPPLENGQPLPPGVDFTPDSYSKPKEQEITPPDTLITALDSFYSEIAEVTENTNSCSPASSQIPEIPAETVHETLIQSTAEVKKKKKKVKLVQGLTMKKKGVSELVEKWKNVQKNYTD